MHLFLFRKLFVTFYKYNALQAQWVISMEHMKEKGLVEHKVEVPAHINSCTALSHLKEGNLITGMWKRVLELYSKTVCSI